MQCIKFDIYHNIKKNVYAIMKCLLHHMHNISVKNKLCKLCASHILTRIVYLKINFLRADEKNSEKLQKPKNSNTLKLNEHFQKQLLIR